MLASSSTATSEIIHNNDDLIRLSEKNAPNAKKSTRRLEHLSHQLLNFNTSRAIIKGGELRIGGPV